MLRRDKPDHSKEQFWRDLLGQWQRSTLSIRAFCAQHGVSEPSFYAWRRTFAQRHQQASRSPTRTARRPGAKPPAPTFVPVQVVPTPPANTTIEVVLGQGRSIRLAPGFDPATLRQLLAILETPAC
jgi:transposase